MKRLIWLLLCSVGFAQTSTVTGVIKDLTGANVTSGKVTFNLTPSRDTTISGLARFSPQTVTCPIGSTGNIVSLVNSNITTSVGTTSPGTSVVVSSATGWALNQSIAIPGAGAAGAIYIGTVSNIAGTTFTISPATTSAVNAGTLVYDPCQMTMNTSLQPTGTYYVVGVWPANVKVAAFTFYAVNSTYDWSTVVPTPTTSPAQNFVDIFSGQTIGGNKTFTGNTGLGAGTTTLGVIAGSPDFTSISPTFGTIGGAAISFPGTPTFAAGLKVQSGVSAGTGMQHVRVASCTTAAGAFANCNTTVTWTVPFPNTSYTAVCGIEGVGGHPFVASYQSKLAASISITISTNAADASNGNLNCIAMHD